MVRRAFFPIRTARLVLRPLAPRDVTAFTRYRNLPEVARYQDWRLPYTRDHAHALVDAQAAFDRPTPGEWIQIAVVADRDTVVGDLAVGMDESGSLATIGYTLDPAYQGLGYATEAAGALVDALIERLGVHRVAATLDPANVASARVLERLGFRYEGRSVNSAFVRDEWLDDDRYAILPAERRAWLDLDVRPPRAVRLIEVHHANAGRTTRLRVHHSQERFVASVLESIADAAYPEPDEAGVPVVPWLRAVEADGEIVGFVMLAEATRTSPEPYLWRLLVDRAHQGRGIGRRIVELVVDRLAAEGHETLLVSWVPGPGSPDRFYVRLGFRATGELDGDEVVGRLRLSELVRAGA